MRNKLLNIIPYILGVIYLAYCLFNVENWVKSHTEEYFIFVVLAWAVAIILSIVFLILRFIKKQNLKMYLPIFFFVIGLIVYLVALNISCCMVG